MRTHGIVLLAAIALISPAEAALAFCCVGRASVAEELNSAMAVFSGHVIADEYRPVVSPVSYAPAGSEVLVVRVAVEQWWKGSGEFEVVLQTAVIRRPDGTVRRYSSDFRFRVGERYLVYAYGPAEQLRTDDCRRTAALEKAEEDLRWLGAGRLPDRTAAFSMRPQPNSAR